MNSCTCRSKQHINVCEDYKLKTRHTLQNRKLQRQTSLVTVFHMLMFPSWVSDVSWAEVSTNTHSRTSQNPDQRVTVWLWHINNQ